MNQWLIKLIGKNSWHAGDEALLKAFIGANPQKLLDTINSLYRIYQAATFQPPVGLSPQQKNQYWYLVENINANIHAQFVGDNQTNSSQYTKPTYHRLQRLRERSRYTAFFS